MSDRGIGDAPATVPAVLLPVRLETRWVNGDLLVRIYPDRWHTWSHQDQLTVTEADAGGAFWAASADERVGVWASLRASFGTPRASWILRTTKAGRPPDGQLRTAAWDIAVQARGLPDRWVAAGFAAEGTSPVVVAIGADIVDGLAVGPTPGATPGEGPAQVDAGMAWLVDFQHALDAGMAIRIPQPQALARLVIVGLRARADGGDGATTLAMLLKGHRYSDGLELVPQGTPTNAERAPDAEDDQTSLARALGELAAEPDSADGPRLAGALGIDRATLTGVRYGDGHENADAQAVNAVMWPVTWGNLLGSLLGTPASDRTWESTRRHFVDFVRARGPLAALRIADQPYGVLPVLAQDLNYPAPDEEPLIVTLGQMLQRFGGPWLAAGALRLADPLADRVARTPRPDSVDVRPGWRFLDPVYTHFMGLTHGELEAIRSATAQQVEQSIPLIGRAVSWSGADYLLPDPPAPVDPLTALEGVLAIVPPAEAVASQLHWMTTADAARLADEATQLAGPDSLLRVLLRTALLRALQLAGQAAAPTPIPALEIRGRLDGGADAPALDALTETYAGTAALASLDPAALQRLIAEGLELASTGWHAWMTSLATRRLALSRLAPAGAGVLLGGYGVVDAPAPGGDPAGSGYVQAPSVSQAVTAAVLQSGALAHAETTSDGLSPFAVDLSSRRVRLAEWLLAGVHEGQPLGVLLGYRFERNLPDTSGSYIAPLRALAPMDPPASTDDPRATAAAATDVVDGLALSRLYHSPAGLPWGTVVAGHTLGPETPALTAALADLDEAIDAVSDALLAEGVHHVINGRPERASGALDAAARGNLTVPELEFVRTPRSGHDLTHRVICLAPPSGELAWPSTSRSEAGPALAAWAASVLGTPDAVDVGLQAVYPATGAPLAQPPGVVALSALGLGPLDLVAVASQPGELAAYVRWWAARDPARVPGLPVGATAAPVDAPPQAGRRRLSAVLAAARSTANLLGQARALDGRDLGVAATDPEADFDELAGRLADRTAALQALATALATPDPAALETAWFLGIPGPLAASPTDAAGIAAVAAAAGELVQTRLRAAAAIPNTGADADPGVRLRALGDAMQALTGERLPVLAILEPADPATAQSAVGATTTAGAAVDQEPATWLARVARASASVAELQTACACSEVLGTAHPLTVAVGQLPLPEPGRTQPWIGLPLDGDVPPARVSLAFVGRPPEAAPQRLAGLVVDEWAETIPARGQTAAVSFAAPTPSAQAPQVALIVAPTGLPAPQWGLEDLTGAVVAAMNLAQGRLAERADLPATPMLPAISVDGQRTGTPAGVPSSRLFTPPQGYGIADQDGAPSLSGVSGQLDQHSGGSITVSGAHLDGATYQVNAIDVGIRAVTGASGTGATLDVVAGADAPPSDWWLQATTALGQTGISVSVRLAPKLLSVATPQPLVQAETATHFEVELVGQALVNPSSPVITGAAGITATVSATDTAGDGTVTVHLNVAVPGVPRPVSDWNPSEPGSPLKPPKVPTVPQRTAVALLVTLRTDGGQVTTAGLSPGLTMSALSWEDS